MNILYVENDKKLISLISENCMNSIHETILLNNPKDALLFLEQTKNIDLIITEINFRNLDVIFYLKKIREIKEDIFIVITSKLDIYSSFDEFIDLNISKILKKPFKMDKLKNTIDEISEKINLISNKDEIEDLRKSYFALQILNEELNSFIKI